MQPYLKISKQDLVNMNQKEIMGLCYAYMKCDKENNVRITIADLKQYFNYSITNRHNNGEFNQAIDNLVQKGYLKKVTKFDYKIYPLKDDGSYLILNPEEVVTIKNYEKTHSAVNWDNLLICYLTIKSFINMSNELKYCFPSIDRLSVFCGLSRNTILKTIQQLKDIGLVKTYDFGRWKDRKGSLRFSPIVYAIQGTEQRIKSDYETFLGGKFIF